MEESVQARPRRYHTYTKKMMTRIINVALIDMQFPFLLALLGRDQIAETLGGLIVTEIIGVFLSIARSHILRLKKSSGCG